MGFYGMNTSYDITTQEVNASSLNVILPVIRGYVQGITGTQTPTKFSAIDALLAYKFGDFYLTHIE